MQNKKIYRQSINKYINIFMLWIKYLWRNWQERKRTWDMIMCGKVWYHIAPHKSSCQVPPFCLGLTGQTVYGHPLESWALHNTWTDCYNTQIYWMNDSQNDCQMYTQEQHTLTHTTMIQCYTFNPKIGQYWKCCSAFSLNNGLYINHYS